MEPRSANHLALGTAIAERRRELGLSQEDLGFESGVDRTYVGGVERGERNISFTNLMRLALALETGPSDLLRAAEGSSTWLEGATLQKALRKLERPRTTKRRRLP